MPAKIILTFKGKKNKIMLEQYKLYKYAFTYIIRVVAIMNPL